MKTVTGLKMLLHSHNMTQGELAESLGVSQATVSHWSTGKIKMSKDVQEKIFKAVENRNKPITQIIEEEVKVVEEAKVVEKPKKDLPKTLEARIKECKKFCMEQYGFKVVIVDNK